VQEDGKALVSPFGPPLITHLCHCWLRFQMSGFAYAS
jgi:hypothetical protein